MLDVPSITFLSNYLQSYPSTLLVVSHDRAFLNEVATDIIHQHSERLDYYKGADFGKIFMNSMPDTYGSNSFKTPFMPRKKNDGKPPNENMKTRWPSGLISKHLLINFGTTPLNHRKRSPGSRNWKRCLFSKPRKTSTLYISNSQTLIHCLLPSCE